MHILADSIPLSSGIFLLLAVGLALAFEFVNGFHDTANAVATVIYTHSLPPWIAVIWSGCWNLIGVLTSSGLVAFTVLALLPVELVLNVGSSAGFAMVFALLISAILWNVGTWYLGLPASSSHTLIGSIMGVGLANSMMSAGHSLAEGINWGKAREVFTTLLVSPLVGFVCAGLLLILAKLLLSNRPALFKAPPTNQPPPLWIRSLLVLTCTGVSFAHGSNDGQKGMGLILLILIGVIPGAYALNMNTNADDLRSLQANAAMIQPSLTAQSDGFTFTGSQAADEVSSYIKSSGTLSARTYAALASLNRNIIDTLANKQSLHQISTDARRGIRTNAYLIGSAITKLDKAHKLGADQKSFAAYQTQLDSLTKFIPVWIKFAIAIALGLGTMIGWKRIVTTVGEKIGKEHLTYAQGASAELVAMATIMAADRYGLPVSTTHVLSSGIAGTMAANRSGLQMATLRNIMLAWVLTLPVCVLLGAATFSAGLYIIFHTPVSLVLLAVAFVTMGYVVWRFRFRTAPIAKPEVEGVSM